MNSIYSMYSIYLMNFQASKNFILLLLAVHESWFIHFSIHKLLPFEIEFIKF